MIGHVVRVVLRERDFRLACADAACNAFSFGGEQVALGLLVYRISGSSAWVGFAFALYLAPMLVLGAGAGAVADRSDRRRMLRAIELGSGLVLASFALVLAHGRPGLALVLAASTLSGCVRATYHPVRTSYAYDLVGPQRVVAGLGLVNLSTRGGQLLGALAAGAAMQHLGAGAAYAMLALAHVVAFGVLSRLRAAGVAAERDPTPLGEGLREFAREMRRNRTLLTLVLVTACVEVFGFSFVTALPELAITRFGAGAEALGALHAARAFGGLVAAATLAGVPAPRRPGRLWLLVVGGFGIALALLAAAPVFAIAALALAFIAAAAATSDVLTQSMVQLSVPNRLRGRAMGAWVLAVGSGPLGHLEVGALVAAFGAGAALAANAAALVAVATLAALAAPGLRRA